MPYTSQNAFGQEEWPHEVYTILDLKMVHLELAGVWRLGGVIKNFDSTHSPQYILDP